MHLDLELVHVGEVRNCSSERVAGPLGFRDVTHSIISSVYSANYNVSKHHPSW